MCVFCVHAWPRLKTVVDRILVLRLRKPSRPLPVAGALCRQMHRHLQVRVGGVVVGVADVGVADMKEHVWPGHL